MSIRERLKIAYENVTFDADNTWSKEFSSYQQTNMNLLLREKGLLEPKYVELRPRTVRDRIPNSKLAKYANYEYNDSRELSYTLEDFKTSSNFEYNFGAEKEKEPWMLDEVDAFFKLFTDFYKCLIDSKEEQNRFKYVTTFESPLMKSNSLSEYFLKLQITRDDVKRLWDTESLESRMFMFRSLQSIRGEKSVLVYKSPAGRVYVSEYDDVSSELKQDYCEWFKYDMDVGIDNVNFLSNPIKSDVKDTNQTENRRLYSAVLQGFASNKIAPPVVENQMTILRRNFSSSNENVMEKLGTINNFAKRKVDSPNIPKLFPNANATNSRSVQTNEIDTNVGCQNTFFPLRQHQTTVRYRQNYTPSNYQYPSFYMFVHNSFQQNYLQPFYNPIFFQRTVPISLDRSMFQCNPPTFKSYNNFSLNIHHKSIKSKSRKKLNDYSQKNNLPIDDNKKKKKINLSSSDCSIYKDMEELVSKSLNLVLEDESSLPITGSNSEELERQALEQYTGFSDNVFQDLERQAAEEYEDSSENYINPPNSRSFGGFFIKNIKYCIY